MNIALYNQKEFVRRTNNNNRVYSTHILYAQVCVRKIVQISTTSVIQIIIDKNSNNEKHKVGCVLFIYV